jgi:hypothetical protein
VCRKTNRELWDSFRCRRIIKALLRLYILGHDITKTVSVDYGREMSITGICSVAKIKTNFSYQATTSRTGGFQIKFGFLNITLQRYVRKYRHFAKQIFESRTWYGKSVK